MACLAATPHPPLPPLLSSPNRCRSEAWETPYIKCTAGCPALPGHSWPWLAMAGHGWPCMAMHRWMPEGMKLIEETPYIKCTAGCPALPGHGWPWLAQTRLSTGQTSHTFLTIFLPNIHWPLAPLAVQWPNISHFFEQILHLIVMVPQGTCGKLLAGMGIPPSIFQQILSLEFCRLFQRSPNEEWHTS